MANITQHQGASLQQFCPNKQINAENTSVYEMEQNNL